jgi:hypothetical protein
MNFVVFPTQALCDPNSSPFMFCKKTEDPRVIRAEEVLRNHLQELFGKNNMTVLRWYYHHWPTNVYVKSSCQAYRRDAVLARILENDTYFDDPEDHHHP